MAASFLSHSITLEILWELMRLYDWRIITYLSSFPVDRKDRKRCRNGQLASDWPFPTISHRKWKYVG